ncbi:MAG: type III pantothenate kinase [Bacteroidetes bacterium]|nr:type III pantothenate kinase [Bacteroidota bacterium]
MKSGILDIGNSSVKWALFEGDDLLESGVCTYGEWEKLRQLHTHHAPISWFMSSVQQVPSTAELGFKCEELDLNHALPVTILYQTPSTLGKDRIAGICGARHLFPNQACLVIDAGTCITFDLVDAEGNYPGGSISPGIQMRLKAMHEQTGRLPLLDWEDPDGFIGDSTKMSMLQGVKQGVLGECERQIRLYKERYPSLQILITGGDCSFFEINLKMDIFAAPNLVLTGLNTILHYKKSLDA